jgi:hypothetical protein
MGTLRSALSLELKAGLYPAFFMVWHVLACELIPIVDRLWLLNKY